MLRASGVPLAWRRSDDVDFDPTGGSRSVLGENVEKTFPAYQGDEPYVFISYAHGDASVVYPELERLNTLGFNVWYDEGISPGSVWRDELARRIENCGVFVLFVSARACASDNCLKELNLALSSGRPVLAVYTELTELPPGLRLSLSDRQAILKYELPKSAYRNKLEAALRKRLVSDGTTTASVQAAPKPASKLRRTAGLAAAAMLGTVAIVAVAWWVSISRAPSIESQVMAALPGDDRPAIAVLPFKNLGASADDAYFADGLTEDLINRLGSWRRFPVIGSPSSLGYRDDSKDANQIAKELNARYLVRGTVRRSAEAVRIDVGLYDATSGVQIWNEHYDRPFGDVLTVQDAISEAIVGAMYPELQGFDVKRALRRDPKDLTAWDLAQRGEWHFVRFTAPDNALAIKYFGQAIARDPGFATAEAALTEALYTDISSGWTDTPEHSIAQLVQSAERAVLVDNRNGSSQHALGHAYALTGNRAGMIQAFKTSLELDPNSSLGQVCAGEGLAMAGESDAAIEVLNRALQLSPRDPGVSWTYHAMALAYFAKENYPESVNWAQRAVSDSPQVTFFHRTLATSLAHAGRVDEARAALARATDLEPAFTLGGGRRIMLAGNPEMADRYMSGLRMAGLK
jgi:TolB-like protein